MVKPIEIEAQSLRLAARQLTSEAQDADATLSSFQSQIDGLGQPWGDDDLGMVIGMVYQGALALVMNCLSSHLDVVDGLAERLGIAADNYDETDFQSAERLDGIRSSAPDVAI